MVASHRGRPNGLQMKGDAMRFAVAGLCAAFLAGCSRSNDDTPARTALHDKAKDAAQPVVPAADRLNDDDPGIRRLVFFPDSRRFLSFGADLVIWDIKANKPIRKLENSRNEFQYCAAISPDNKRILVGTCGGALVLWDSDSGKRRWVVNPQQGWVHACAFSPDGTTALTGTNGSLEDEIGFPLTLWDLGNTRAKSHLDGHRRMVTSLAFSKDGTLAVSKSADKTVRVWELSTAKLLKTFEDERGGSVVFSPDQKQVISRGATTTWWSLESGKVAHTVKLPAQDPFVVAFSADSALAASVEKDGTVSLWTLRTGAFLRNLERVEGLGRGTYPLEFS